MSNQTREEKELAIKVFSLAMWGAVVLFVVLAPLFYLEIIPSGQGTLIAIGLLAVAVFDVFLIKFMVGKMQTDLDK